MPPRIRCQGAIVRDSQVLLIQHREHASGRSYWLLPGGGKEDGESAEEGVVREMREETGLEVKVERLLFVDPGFEGKENVYNQYLTYLCRILSGEPKPGYEPEVEASELYGIAKVGWFDLRDEAGWGEEVLGDQITYPLMKRIQKSLLID
jgi:ADP-ribose pyrophosphatase YjhB (NUDIX family)